MAGLAPGGHSPVITMSMMGVSALIIGSFIDPIAGLIPLFGILCLMLAVFLGYFWRDPDRPVPREDGVLVAPADGHALFLVRERAIGRRPTIEEREKEAIHHDPLTGDWFPSPLDDPSRFPPSNGLRPSLSARNHPRMCGGLLCLCRRLTFM